MYFRSLLKTRLLRPIAFGLSHPYLPFSSVRHWIKCTPAKTYFYLFSTQKQQSQKDSVKVPIENFHTKGEGETPAKNPKKLQKEINKNSNTKKDVEIQANEPKEQKREVKPQNQKPNEFLTKIRIRRSNKPIGQVATKLDENMKIMIEKMLKKDQIMIEEIKKKDQNVKIMLEEIQKKLKFSMKKSLYALTMAILFTALCKTLQAGYYYYFSTPNETEPKNYVEGGYIETSSRASVKKMFIQSIQEESQQMHYISGVPGIGKTTTMKEIIKQMEQENCSISYFSFKQDNLLETTIYKILACAFFIQYFNIFLPKDKKKYIMIDQFNQITVQKTIMKITNLTMDQRLAKREDIVKTMRGLTRLGFNIVFISSDLNFFAEILSTQGISEKDFKKLNFNQPSIRQQTEYLKSLRSKTNPALKLDDEVIISHMIQNYSTFREMKQVLTTYFANSGNRAKTLQKSKLQVDQSKQKMKMHSQISVGQLSDKDKALYEVCLQKLMPKPVHDKFYDQLNQTNILNQKYFRSLLTLRGFELYYNENPSKFEKNLPQKVKEQFKDHKIHCKEVFLDRPVN